MLSLKNGTIEINLGDTTAQDLLIDLGPPLRKYWKEDDRLGRVWGGQPGPNTSTTADDDATGESQSTPCFWNYFQYGMDFLIENGVVTKVNAHTNIVSRADVRRTDVLIRHSQERPSSSNTRVARGSCSATQESSTTRTRSVRSGRGCKMVATQAARPLAPATEHRKAVRRTRRNSETALPMLPRHLRMRRRTQ